MGNRSGASLVKAFNINPENGAARRNWWNVQAVPYELGSSAETHVFTPPEFHRAIFYAAQKVCCAQGSGWALEAKQGDWGGNGASGVSGVLRMQ